MSQLRQTEQRIESVGTLRDIVSSMRSLAGAYLQRAQGALANVRAYEEIVETGLALAVRSVPLPPSSVSPWETPCLLAFTSDQGLCGPFVESLAKATIRRMEERKVKERCRLLVVGQQGQSIFKRLGIEAELVSAAPNSLQGAMSCIRPLTEVVGRMYEEGTVTSVQLVYNVFQGIGRFDTQWRQLLPPDWDPILQRQEAPTFPPVSHRSFSEMLNVLIEEFLFIGLHRAMVESMASENGSRMRAMNAATQNCEELLDDLQRVYMQLRQGEITNELLDVAAGAEALRTS